MKTVRKVAFLVVVVVAVFGRSQSSQAAMDACRFPAPELYLSGEGTCFDMVTQIVSELDTPFDNPFTGMEECVNYCDYVAWCRDDASECWVHDESCDDQYGEWFCDCLCAG